MKFLKNVLWYLTKFTLYPLCVVAWIAFGALALLYMKAAMWSGGLRGCNDWHAFGFRMRWPDSEQEWQ